MVRRREFENCRFFSNVGTHGFVVEKNIAVSRSIPMVPSVVSNFSYLRPPWITRMPRAAAAAAAPPRAMYASFVMSGDA